MSNYQQTSQTEQPVLRIDQISRAIDGRCLVDRITLDVRRGETLAIVGPSGAGKSSLLRLINRLDEPTAGSIYLNGADYHVLPPRELRRSIGMVFQAPHLFAGTVADNVRFGPLQHGSTLDDVTLAALLDQVRLAGYAARNVATLSGGEAQRVSLARTLANQPQVLLLDEPTAALDQTAERAVEATIAQIASQRDLTVLIVTHNMAQAARLADRVLVIEAGRVARLGPVAEVLGDPTVVG